MGFELINRINIKKDGVYISSHSSNDNQPFRYWKCESLSEIYFNEVETEVKEQIDYNSFVHTDRLDEIVNIIIEIYTSHQDRKINGCIVPYNVIKNVFHKLDYDCIQYVMDCVEEQSKSSRITNMKSYLITALYNAPVYFCDCPKLAELFNDIRTIQKICEKNKIEDVLSRSVFSAEESVKFTFVSFLLALESRWIEEQTTDTELIEMDSKL